MKAYPTRALLDAVDAETPQTGAVWLIERAASFYEGAAVALQEILAPHSEKPSPLAAEGVQIAVALEKLCQRAQRLEADAEAALARIKP